MSEMCYIVANLRIPFVILSAPLCLAARLSLLTPPRDLSNSNSHSSSLSCKSENPISLLFIAFRTLPAKHSGCHPQRVSIPADFALFTDHRTPPRNTRLQLLTLCHFRTPRSKRILFPSNHFRTLLRKHRGVIKSVLPTLQPKIPGNPAESAFLPPNAAS